MWKGTKILRILIAKPGLDGHDRGAKVIAKALMDAGMEVIYTGRHQKVESIVATAVDEDVDIVGLSILSGAHVNYTRRVIEGLQAAGAGDIAVMVGGNIPQQDVPLLKEMGVKGVFTGGSLQEVVRFVQNELGHGAEITDGVL